MTGLLTAPLRVDDIREALRACYDTGNPYGKPVNIVDLGLVEQIELTPDPDAPGAGIPGVAPRQALELTLLTPPGDAHDEGLADLDRQTQLAAQVSNLLAGLAQLSRTRLHFCDEPAWSPARVTAQGRRLLGLEAAPFPILNNHRR